MNMDGHVDLIASDNKNGVRIEHLQGDLFRVWWTRSRTTTHRLRSMKKEGFSSLAIRQAKQLRKEWNAKVRILINEGDLKYVK